MKTSLMAVFMLWLCLSASAAHKKKASSSSAPALRHDLSASLTELQRVSGATDKDIASLGIDKPKSSWKTLWISSGSHKQQAEMAASLQRNLELAMPELIRDVQASRGSLSSTFKLYNDLNAVHQTLESLVLAMDTHAKNPASASLANDLANMGRIRQQLSSYIQEVSASMESGTKLASTSSYSSTVTTNGVKKIIVDDDEPEPAPAKKKTIASR